MLCRLVFQSSSFHTGTISVSPACCSTYCSGSQATLPCDSGSPRVALVTSRREDPIQTVLASSQVASWTHVRVHLGLADVSCRYTRTICTVCLIMRQPRHTTDISMNQRQSFLCCCTTYMEQADDRPEAAAVDRLIL